MNTISKIFFVLFLILLVQENPYYNKFKRPSTYGITQYVEKFQDTIIREYTDNVDSLFHIDVFTENLSLYGDKNDLGAFFPGDNIIILTNKEKYIEYEFKNLTKSKQRLITYRDRTVKAVLFHELTHAYFYQTVAQMKMSGLYVSSEYSFLNLFPQLDLRLGAEFIEEGICEYVVYYLKESSPLVNPFIPKTVKDVVDSSNEIYVKYHYSVYFLTDFLDKYGIKKGIEILVSNKPPSYEEMVNPKLFFERLIYPS